MVGAWHHWEQVVPRCKRTVCILVEAAGQTVHCKLLVFWLVVKPAWNRPALAQSCLRDPAVMRRHRVRQGSRPRPERCRCGRTTVETNYKTSAPEVGESWASKLAGLKCGWQSVETRPSLAEGGRLGWPVFPGVPGRTNMVQIQTRFANRLPVNSDYKQDVSSRSDIDRDRSM